jgi:hypothetical protein
MSIGGGMINNYVKTRYIIFNDNKSFPMVMLEMFLAW